LESHVQFLLKDLSMEYRALNGLPFKASRIGIGTWAMGGWMWAGSDESESVRSIRTALDRGINLIDTAPVYGFGRAEELAGKAVAEHGGRDRVLIATKTGVEWRNGGVARNGTRERILREVDHSLQRLHTDYIDLYQVHWPDPLVPIEETAQAMLDLKQAGKIRAIGVTNFTPQQMDRFRAVAPLDATQSPYNLFEKQSDRDVLPYCRENGVSTIAYGPVCRGLLSGGMRADTQFPGDDLRQVDPKFQPPRYSQYLKAVHELDVFARSQYQTRVLPLAIRWVLDQPGVDVAIWGPSKPEHIDALDGIDGWHLDADARRAACHIVKACVTDPVGPEFMAPPARAAVAPQP
jgi:aryl-alcohol dehydrogenase-like predicted oxidoreductase